MASPSTRRCSGNLGVDESEIQCRAGRTRSNLVVTCCGPRAALREIAVGREQGVGRRRWRETARGCTASTEAITREVALEAAFASMVGLIDNLVPDTSSSTRSSSAPPGLEVTKIGRELADSRAVRGTAAL
jgi:hypothetical protein